MLISFIKKSQFYFISSFAGVIFFGTLLLKLPILRNGGSLEWIDALFTATSAVCVTGLTTIPLTEFTLGGQMLVMMLIQIGGIGIMTMSGSILVFLGKNMSWSESKLMANLTENYSPHGVENMLKTIACYTLLVECLGMFFLFFAFFFDGFKFVDSLWLSLFHSVSAFCNAGFSPLPDNLIGRSAAIKVIIALLIICGGFGMYAVYDIFQALSNRSKRLKLNAKLIVVTSLVLIIGGTLALKFFQPKADAMSWIDAFFQSVTARTAGFNSVDMTTLSSNSVLVLIFLMLIGGAPGSTAGGMKVTTFALVCSAIYNTFSGNQKILIFKREVAISDVLKAFTIAIIFILLTCIGAVVFQMLTEKITAQTAFFEVSSAIGTVGLSLGISPQKHDYYKLLIIFYMFLGRVGPMTMLLFLMGKEKKSHLIYPEEKIVIG